jgi:predicted N-acetyltransferase YhbS
MIWVLVIHRAGLDFEEGPEVGGDEGERISVVMAKRSCFDRDGKEFEFRSDGKVAVDERMQSMGVGGR